MLEILQLANDFQNMVHAIGDINIVKHFSLPDYMGLPESTDAIGQMNQYSFEYSKGATGFSGVCESNATELHCTTNIFDGKGLSEIKDVIELTGNTITENVVKFYEEKMEHLDTFITQKGVRVTLVSKPF